MAQSPIFPNDKGLDLSEDLRGADLRKANLANAEADITGYSYRYVDGNTDGRRFIRELNVMPMFVQW